MSTLFAYFLFVIAQIIIAFNEMLFFFFSQNIFIFFHKIYVLVIPCSCAHARAFSHVHAENHGITDLSHLHTCRSSTA